MRIFKQITDLIGNTPLVELNKFLRTSRLMKPIIAKVEFFNPGGSVKDRIALAMIQAAEKAAVAEARCHHHRTDQRQHGCRTGTGLSREGYKLILTMPETMSVERRNLVKAYGAKVVLTSGAAGMKGAIAEAERLRDSIPGSVILEQSENPANLQRHYETTGKEIWDDTDGKNDIFVAGVGIGGTVSGIGKRLKELNPNVQGRCR